eukprot:1907457-Prymnesium_polylepis.1
MKNRTDVSCDFEHGLVTKDNWATADSSGEVFAVDQLGRELIVMRLDEETGWDIDLAFSCCKATVTAPSNTTPPPPPPFDWAGYSEENAAELRLEALEAAREKAYLRFEVWEAGAAKEKAEEA